MTTELLNNDQNSKVNGKAVSPEALQKLERLTSFWESDPENLHLTTDLLEAFLQAGKLEEGYEWLSNLSDSLIENPNIAYKAGILCLALGHWDKAETFFSVTLNAHPQSTAVAYNLAYAQYILLKFAEAKELLASHQDDWESVPESILLISRCEHQLGEIDEAISHIDRFIQIFPNQYEAQGLKSLLLLDNGNDQEAFDLSSDVLLQDAHQLEALIAQSSAAITLQKLDLAGTSLDNALEKHGNVGRLWSNQGQVDMLSLDIEKAKDSLRKAVECMPDHIGTWHLLGWCQILTSEYDDALNSFNNALALNRNFGDSHGGIAVSLVMKDDLDAAQESMKRAVGLDPTSMAGLYAKSLLLEKKGDVKAAEKVMETIMTSSTASGAMAYLPLLQNKMSKR